MGNEKRVLIVDDEKLVRQSVAAVFQREGMNVTLASSGKEALDILEKQRFDLILLDVMLGDVDGFYVVGVIRQREIHTPLLFLSGNTEESSKILGISLGADDYITKPFSTTMLITKAHALLRRSGQYTESTVQKLTCGPFSFSMQNYCLYKNGETILLTSKETALMRFFMENQRQVFTKEQLYQQVWDQVVVDDNTIMVYVRRLREKIEEDAKKPRFLITVWGIGYCFSNPEEH
jgi:Response regulators consisting of a CheY-like receiver domain and a winged-helix DNA-binding domain